ncbi:winged helix-turn-helix domain-containing protein [Aeromonas hydrophila]|uniref:winged helix-turn-helix domain-containing protein n=1 Tax=Aeromonas hydrophila TaxID=644 RepID=UPI0022AFABF6|nr:winged helix-turn-helix domain-containing protein [Aeromonas hydrophila]MCZ4332159.1 winged helix-turn-helix domain-containing protein [Aeromonas hydrophila]
MMPAVLKVLADGATRSLHEVFERVCQYYTFTTEQLADTLPSKRQTPVRFQVGGETGDQQRFLRYCSVLR